MENNNNIISFFTTHKQITLTHASQDYNALDFKDPEYNKCDCVQFQIYLVQHSHYWELRFSYCLLNWRATFQGHGFFAEHRLKIKIIHYVARNDNYL